MSRCDKALAPRSRPARAAPLAAAALAAAVFLLPAAPAGAGLLSTLSTVDDVGNKGASLKKALGGLIDSFGESAKAVVAGDGEKVEDAWGGVRKTMAGFAMEQIPGFGRAAAVRDGLNAARDRIGRFVGRAGDGPGAAGRKAGGAVADARAALAVGVGERKFYGSGGVGILGGEPLPAVAAAPVARPVSRAAAPAAAPPKGWFGKWVEKEQGNNPDCYGVVDEGSGACGRGRGRRARFRRRPAVRRAATNRPWPGRSAGRPAPRPAVRRAITRRP